MAIEKEKIEASTNGRLSSSSGSMQNLPLAGAPQAWLSGRELGGGMSCRVPCCSPLLAGAMLTEVGGGGGGIMPPALLDVGTPNLKHHTAISI